MGRNLLAGSSRSIDQIYIQVLQRDSQGRLQERKGAGQGVKGNNCPMPLKYILHWVLSTNL